MKICLIASFDPEDFPFNHYCGWVRSIPVYQYTSGAHRVLVCNKNIFNDFDNFIATAIVEIEQRNHVRFVHSLEFVFVRVSIGRCRHRATSFR